MRQFDTGATRDTDEGKLDFEGFLSPTVLERYATYMHANRIQADGNLRDSDNWQKGIPREAYMKSGWRHFFAWWSAWRRGVDGTQDACALLFNVMGWIHETLKGEDEIEQARRQVGCYHQTMTPVPQFEETVDLDYAPSVDYKGRHLREPNLHQRSVDLVQMAKSYGLGREKLLELIGQLATKQELE